MKRRVLLLFSVVALGCTDNAGKCYDCTIKWTTDIYQEPICGYSSSKKVENYLHSEYGGNVVINGQTLKSIDCVKSGN